MKAVILGTVALVSGALTWAFFQTIQASPEPHAAGECASVSPRLPVDRSLRNPRVLASEAIEDVERQRAFYQARFGRSASWLDGARVASAERTLARLTDRFEHYGRADDALAAAFEAAGEGSGPLEAAVSIDFTLHRFAQVDAHLERYAQGAQVPDRVAFLRETQADLAFARGDYAAAREAFEGATETRRSTPNLVRLAAFRAQTGHPAEADALFIEAMHAAQTDRAYNRATLELQRGLLDLDFGRFDEAKAHYEAADEAFGGWYLVQEHLAEIHCLLDDCARSVPMYEAVIEQTQSPELMGAFADVLESLDRAEEGAQWRARAHERYDVLLARFPEALGGHGLEFFLEHGTAERAVELAERNADLRADGEALLLLSQAYLKADRLTDAQAVMDRLMATPYRTPGVFEFGAELATAQGDEETAASLRAQGEAMEQTFAEACDRSGMLDDA